MGSGASKVKGGSRVLAKSAPKQPKGAATVNSTRPAAESRLAEERQAADSDTDVAKRLQQLGPVQFRKMEEKYVPAAEEAFTMTLQARKDREEQGTAELEKAGPRKLLPSVTITAILRSLKEGDSPESVARTYNLDPSVLPRLEKLSVPDVAGASGGNQLLDDVPQQRQPARRRRREPQK